MKVIWQRGHSMTNQEINMMIAGIKGILVVTIKDEVFFISEINKAGNRGELLDYINDWNLLGPLMLELQKTKWNYHWDDQYYDWRWMKLIDRDNFEDVNHKDFGRATCLAYIKEFGGDK